MSILDKDAIRRRWLEVTTDEKTILFAKKLSRVFLARAGDEGVALDTIISNNDWAALLDYTPPMVVGQHLTYQHLAQAQACFNKLECLPNGVDREEAAYRKFLDGEYRCGIFNRIFEKRSEGKFTFSSRTEAILHASARKIDRLIGTCPPIQEVPLRFTVGGATTTIKKKDADLRNLISGCTTVSEGIMADMSKLSDMMASLPHLLDHLQDAEGTLDLRVSSAVLNFVRKNAKTKRAVTNEPDLTKLVQTGYGDVLRARIKRRGIDLTDDERQQTLARQGSIDGRIATLDLSNASGLVSTGLVLDQFPEPWLDVFFWARTSEVYIPSKGETRTLQSYAGMGNGIMFPMESILFHCLAEACCEYENVEFPITSVYGDDIIVSVEAAECVMQVFEEIGLKINYEKSFWSGPFRESCGSDWFSGYDVRPIFIRDLISIEHLYSLHNQFFQKSDTEICDMILDEIPPELRLFGPPGKGDGHLWCDDWQNFARYTTEGGSSHWCYESVSLVPNVRFVVTAHDHLVPLVYAHSSDKDRYLGESPRHFRDLLGSQWARPSGFFAWHRLLKKSGPVPLNIVKDELKALREFAMNFEALSAPVPEQTARHRNRRKWKIRYQGVEKPHKDFAVFGTPLPGSRSVRLCTSYILG